MNAEVDPLEEFGFKIIEEGAPKKKEKNIGLLETASGPELGLKKNSSSELKSNSEKAIKEKADDKVKVGFFGSFMTKRYLELTKQEILLLPSK